MSLKAVQVLRLFCAQEMSFPYSIPDIDDKNWIVASNNLPNKSWIYWVKNTKNQIYKLFFIKRIRDESGFYIAYAHEEDLYTAQITHWMPLLKPPILSDVRSGS